MCALSVQACIQYSCLQCHQQRLTPMLLLELHHKLLLPLLTPCEGGSACCTHLGVCLAMPTALI